MWSKIKSFAIPVSVKLTILYTVILSCILFFTSVLTVAGLFYVLYNQAKDDIDLSVNTVQHYLAAGNPLDSKLLESNLLVPGVMLRVFDEQRHLVLDSSTELPPNRKAAAKIEEDTYIGRLDPLTAQQLAVVNDEDDYFLCTGLAIRHSGHSYHLYFLKTISEHTNFFRILIKSLLITNGLGLLIAVLSGTFISRRILRPLRNIIDTAREIEIKDLGKRINITGSNDELRELASTFNHMLNRIQTGFEQQRRFVSDASHELRTPVTVISGYADMLDRWGKQDPDALDEGVEAIKSEAANMYGLIEKLLFLARADQASQILNKAPTDMQPLIGKIVQETRLIAPRHQIMLDCNDAAAIYADASSIKEMLRVFIENSIKFTPAGGTITISSKKINSHLEVTVKDTGIGIPAEEQSKIFDRFYRIDKSRSKTSGGTGLGLAIASWIAEQHDSPISLTSEPGHGTTVTVHIPLLPDEKPPQAEKEETTH